MLWPRPRRLSVDYQRNPAHHHLQLLRSYYQILSYKNILVLVHFQDNYFIAANSRDYQHKKYRTVSIFCWQFFATYFHYRLSLSYWKVMSFENSVLQILSSWSWSSAAASAAAARCHCSLWIHCNWFSRPCFCPPSGSCRRFHQTLPGHRDDNDNDDDDDDDDDDDVWWWKTSPGRLVITNLSSSAGMQPACAINIYIDIEILT